MKREEKFPAMDANEQIPALIETLLATEQRLEELTGGEVDTVAGRDGRTFLLRRAQEHLRFSEAARQAAILNALPAHIALLDPLGMIISVNEAWRRFAQANVFHAPGHGVGINYLDVCDRAQGDFSSEAHQVAAGIRAVLGGTETSWSIEYPCHSPTAQRWFLLTVTPLAKDRQNGAVVMHLNITERRQAETAAIRLAAIVESSGDAIIGKNVESIITSWNKGAELLFGYAAAEMVGTSIMRLMPAGQPDDHQHILARIKRGETVATFETVRQTKAGTLVDISVTASPIRDATSKVIGVSIAARDVTERMRAESALCASQANMAAAQRLAHFGSWELELTHSKNVDANALRWSDEMFRIAGYEPAAVAVSSDLFFRLVHPDDREPIRQAVKTAIHERREYSIVHRLIRPDGETRVVQETGQIVCEEKTGQPLKIVGTAHDITEQRKAEEALRESEERFSGAFEHAPIGVAVVSPDGRWLKVNQALCNLVGYSEAELQTRTILDLTHPEDVELSQENVRRAIAGESRSIQIEKRYIHKHGHVITALLNISLVRDGQGQPRYFVAQIQDITERKHSEQVIARGLQRLTEAQRIGQIGDWEYDLATQAITWSPQVFEIFGRDPRLGPPRNYEENTALFDAASQAIQTEKVARAIESGEAQDYELRAHRPNGTPVDVLGRAVPRKDESGKVVGLVGTVQDITARKRMEEALRESEEHFRFLNDLAEATRPLAEPERIMAATARMLGEHLRASRCAYADVENDGEQFTILHDYTNGCATTVGKYQLSRFGARAVATLHNGQTLIIRDVNAELLPGEGADTFNAVGIQAIISCPLVKGGSLRAIMAVHQTTPRDWKPGEVALVQDVVERCWATIERRTAEAEVQQSQKRLRDIFDGLGPAMFVGLLTPQGILIEVNQSPLTAAGLKPDDVLGKPFAEARWWSHSPEAQRQLREAIARAARGESSRYDVRVQGVGEQVIDIDFSLQPLRDKTGEVVFLIPSASVITERKLSEGALEKTHKELVKASRQAGMAEVATGILHNVGNVLNSVNIASACVAESIRKSKSVNLARVVKLLRDHAADLGAFLTVNAQGKQIPDYLAQLAEHLVAEQALALEELAQLHKNIEHIKDIVAMQQGLAKTSRVTEIVNVTDLVEDALRMNQSGLARRRIEVIREFNDSPLVTVERHQALQILVNLVRNAKQACEALGDKEKKLTIRTTNRDGRVRIAVCDNGVGIPSENLIRIFSHGFTTKKNGHGFGLHSGALAAKEMGGSLTVRSDGPGRGAAFTLELPVSGPGELP